MKLMQAVSTYQLLELTVYRKIYISRDDNVVLIIPYWLKSKILNIGVLEECFDKIIFFNFFPDYNLSNVDEQIINYYNTLFHENMIVLNEFEEIHVAGAHYGIGNYLCLIEHQFFLWEDASGVIFEPDILRDIEKNLSIMRLKFNDKLGLIDGSSNCIIKIFANLSNQSKNINDKIIHFDIVDELNSMIASERENIISIFSSVNQIQIPKDSTLLLTEHFANCKRLSFEDQILIYELYIDYFLVNDNVVIKTHPDDLMYYDQIFPNFGLVREKFPSEFIEFIFNNKPKKLATISSASVKALKKSFPDSLTLDNNFEKFFKNINKYYCALFIATQFTNYETIEKLNTYDILLNNLYLTNFYKTETHSKFNGIKTYIIDDFNNNIKATELLDYIKFCNSEDIFIFINSKQEYLFHNIKDEEIWNCIIPICINKRKKNENKLDFYCDTENEVFYIYTKNKIISERILKMNIEKSLVNTGIELHKQFLDDKEMEIEILKGKLLATEKRLKYYIELVESKEEGERE